ncbi:chemotaxis protein CheB [Polluticoccus soli]|uniref:chemotaxis protein CheB n=1 Tax=Polluticoccus soli TaxID=3034150 RepID=UPI0023E24824|nr:chemotaxis protein CheB [Flavipsychrobacter sp. JY13-12]
MIEVVAIGGSAGSLPVVMAILKALPSKFDYSVILVIHRLKNVSSEMERILAGTTDLQIREPEDKEPIKPGVVYLAPQNYHLQIEADRTFSLDYSELVNYSRPSIDVTFECVATIFKEKAVAVLLSGANADGAAGLDKIVRRGGVGIAQDPASAEYKLMPQSALDRNKEISSQSPEHIVNYISTITSLPNRKK